MEASRRQRDSSIEVMGGDYARKSVISRMSSVLVIRKSALPSLPDNVQEYVGEHFREQKVLGIPCLVAARHVYHPNGDSYSRWGDGVAPCHSVDLMHYGKSYRGKEVNEELRLAQTERPEDVYEAYVTESRTSSIECD